MSIHTARFNANKAHEIIAELEQFLDILPSDYLGGVDTYDLIYSLQLDEKHSLAKKIINRLQFRWRMRKKYIRAKLGFKLG